MAITAVDKHNDGMYVSTSGCGCCGDSIRIEHRDAKLEVSDTLEVIVDYCEAIGIKPRTLLNKYLKGESW